MKRTRSKLHLRAETVKVLRNDTLEDVAGGTIASRLCPTYTCATACLVSVCAPTTCLTVHNCVKG